MVLGKFLTIEFDDLYQSGYLAFREAVERYEQGRGKTFIGFLAWRLKNAFATATVTRSVKQQKDIFHFSTSLDAPVYADNDATTLAHTVPEVGAQWSLDKAEQDIFNWQFWQALEAAMKDFTPRQRGVIERRYFKGETLKQTAAHYGVSCEAIRQQEANLLRRLRRPEYNLYQYAYQDIQ